MEAIDSHSSTDFKNHQSPPPPPRFFSYPNRVGGGASSYAPPPPLINIQNPRRHHYKPQQQHIIQPPLLPLPIPNTYQNKRNCMHQSLSIKKATTSTSSFLHGSQKKEKSKAKMSSNSGTTTTSRRLGPEPKDVPKVFTFSATTSASVLSPPPSSLPLPTFFLRQKLSSCKEEVAVGHVDAGATDNIRRMLRLT